MTSHIQNEGNPSDVVDLDHWRQIFPLVDLEERIRRLGSTISSPCQLAAVEQVREAILHDEQCVDTVPVDVFLFSKGRPSRRDLTQFGGLPYRPAKLPWPNDEEGNPLTFLGQLRFCESRDLFPELPGDILLVFVDDAWVTHLHHEWYSLGQTDLVAEEDLPETSWQIPTFWGVRHRSVDYQDREAVFPALTYAAFNGTKIGGISRYQFDTLGRYSDQAKPPHLFEGAHFYAEPEGRFLASFCSLQAEPNRQHPWLNRIQPLSLKELHTDNEVVIGDMHWLELFLQDDGRIFWRLAPD